MGRSLFVILGGVVAAAQIGKAIAALPALRAEFGLGLDSAAFILSVFAALGAGLAIPASLVASRMGARRSFSGGLALIAVASAAGAAAPTAGVLLATRFVEGAGFLGVILAGPGLIARLAQDSRRSALMAAWGAFMGLGAVVALLAAQGLATIGWRGLWLGLAAAAAAMAGAAGFALPADPPAASIRAEARVALASPACRRLALAFFLYAALYFVVSGFLPELLVGRFGLTLATANLVAAAAIGANAAGNLAASALIARGVAPRRTMAAAFAAFMIAAAPLFTGAAPALSLAAAFFALGIGGLCPASIFASLAGAAPRAALMPATGLLMQASHLGQFAGPALAGFVVERWGWAAIAAPIGATAAAGLALVALTRPRP